MSIGSLRKDHNRSAASDDFSEDMFRCRQNGPKDMENFQPRNYMHACTDCFGHRLVKSAEEKKEIKRTIMPSNNDNGRRIMRTIEKLRALKAAIVIVRRFRSWVKLVDRMHQVLDLILVCESLGNI